MLFGGRSPIDHGGFDMKKLLSISAILAAFACATTSAFADGMTQLSGVSVRLGAFFPTQSSTSSATSSTWFAAGVDYKVGTLSLPHLTAGAISVSLDYAQKDSYTTIPLLLNYTSGKTVYWSVGAGVSFAQFVQDDGTNNNRVRFAYSAGLGYNLPSGDIPLFVEARFFGDDQPRVAGVAAYVGARF